MLLCGILILPAQLGQGESPAGENLSGVGYWDYPESCGLLFTDQNDRGAFIFLDFENITTSVYLFPDRASLRSADLPYNTDYTFLLADGFAGRLCDRLGGIEMPDENGRESLYFSSALAEFCSGTMDFDKMHIISQSFFEKISKTGLSSEDFMFIIEEADTDVSYTVCYEWIGHIKEMFLNCVFH
jgi:hypothetical protein